MQVYFNDRFIPVGAAAELPLDAKYFVSKEQVRISPDDRGFTFGDGVYEVLRSYSGRLFEFDHHMLRLQNSLVGIRIAGWNTLSFRPIVERLLLDNDLLTEDAKIYIQVTRGDAPRDHAFPPNGTPLTIFTTTSTIPTAADSLPEAAPAVLTEDYRWTRCDIKQIGLLPGVLANQRAHEVGAFEALFVRDGKITEGTHTNFCAIIDGTLHTHPANNLVLPGITRAVVLDICRELGIPVVEEALVAAELMQKIGDKKAAVEAMVLGTITEIKPIGRIEDQLIGDGRPGPLTGKIFAAFRKKTQS
ncbi:MAG: aminotransferase class IV [Candidatus Neomarinimicrobiota bacterium]